MHLVLGLASLNCPFSMGAFYYSVLQSIQFLEDLVVGLFSFGCFTGCLFICFVLIWVWLFVCLGFFKFLMPSEFFCTVLT